MNILSVSSSIDIFEALKSQNFECTSTRTWQPPKALDLSQRDRLWKCLDPNDHPFLHVIVDKILSFAKIESNCSSNEIRIPNSNPQMTSSEIQINCPLKKAVQ